MSEPTAPVPTTPAAPAAPAPATPSPLEGTAGDIAARLRARAGLPAKAPDPKATAPAAPAVTAPAEAAADKPAEEKPPEEPKKSDGQLALELVREQKARRAAEQRANELEARVKTGETESAPITAARTKWEAGKFADAIRDAFGVKNFSDDFLVQLAQADAAPEPLTPEQLREQIREQLKAELKADQDAQAAQLAQLREAAVTEVGETLTKSPDRWPTVWRFGVSGERIGEVMDANRSATAEQIFDLLEKDYRANVEGLPYWQKGEPAPAPAADPPPPAAPRSFGTESRRGPVPTTEPAKPQTAEERWEARRKADAEWKAKLFGARN